MKRRSFIKGTAAGTLALGVGFPDFPAIPRESIRLGQPLPKWKVAYWHDHLLGFIQKYGQWQMGSEPKDPEWKQVEQGRLHWIVVMPFAPPLYRDVAHIDEEVAECAYAFSEVEMSIGRVRVDCFTRDSCNPAALKILTGGKLSIVTVNGKLAGYTGYMTKPEDLSLNFWGFPFKGQILQAWTPLAGQLESAISPCNLLRKA